MTNWNNIKISDIAEVIGGGTPSTKQPEFWGNDIPWLTPKDLSGYNNRYILSGERSISNEGLKNSSARILPKGSILLTSRAPIGYLAIAEQELCTNQGFKSLILKQGNNSEFFYYLLKNNIEYIKNMSSGSTFAEISGSQVKNLEFSIPPLETQQKIAKILSAIDDKIELNNSINNNLEQQAQCYFDEIISRNKNMKYSEIGNICNVKGGKRLPKGVNLITAPNNHPYIRVRDLNSICVAQLNNEYEYVDDETQKSISRYIVNSNDIIISIVGTIGLTAIIGKTLNNANLTENCVKLTNLTHVTPEFLLLFLRSKVGQELIKKSTVGAVQAKLPIKNIQAIKVPIFYDIGFNNYLKLVFTNISNNILENQSLIHIRDLLLPKLMSGEIDVSNVDISADKLYEPANESKLSAEPYNSSGSFASASKNLPSEQSSSTDKLLFSEDQ